MKPRIRRRPTIEQLREIAFMVGKAYGDGDYLSGKESEHRKRIQAAMTAFEDWRLSLVEEQRWKREEGRKI